MSRVRADVHVRGEAESEFGGLRWDTKAAMNWRVYATDKELGLEQEGLDDWSGDPMPPWEFRLYALSYFRAFRFSPVDRRVTRLEGDEVFRQRMRAVAARSDQLPKHTKERVDYMVASADWPHSLRSVLEDIDLTVDAMKQPDGRWEHTAPRPHSECGNRSILVHLVDERSTIRCPGELSSTCRRLFRSSHSDPILLTRAFALTRTLDQGNDETGHQYVSEVSWEAVVDSSSARLLSVRVAEAWEQRFTPAGGTPVRHYHRQEASLVFTERSGGR